MQKDEQHLKKLPMASVGAHFSEQGPVVQRFFGESYLAYPLGQLLQHRFSWAASPFRIDHPVLSRSKSRQAEAKN